MAEIKKIRIEKIRPNPKQPRKNFSEKKLKELASSIESAGLIQPILVRPVEEGFELVHGERRLRAHELIGAETIRAEVREMSDEEALQASLTENLQREDINPISEAESFETMMNEFELTQEEIAERVGKSRSYVANSLRLLDFYLDQGLSTRELKETIRQLERGDTVIKIVREMPVELLAKEVDYGEDRYNWEGIDEEEREAHLYQDAIQWALREDVKTFINETGIFNHSPESHYNDYPPIGVDRDDKIVYSTNPPNGCSQNSTLDHSVQERNSDETPGQKDKVRKLFRIIHGLADENEGAASKKEVVVEAEASGISSEFVDEFIRREKTGGRLEVHGDKVVEVN